MAQHFHNLDEHAPIGGNLLRWRWEKFRAGVPKPPDGGYAAFEREWLVTPEFPADPSPRVWWLGHATVLLRIDGLHIITDPQLSERASPFSFVGPKRLVAAPAQVPHLPRIDVLLISHNHYDHLDAPTIRALLRANPAMVCYVPLGLKTWFQKRGAQHVHELGWWEKHGLQDLEIHCVPAQHWSARSLMDRNQTLWSGWVVKNRDLNFYFSGDTGYSPRLQEIASRLGSPDIAALPIGAYAPRWFMRTQHVNPPEAAQLHRELRARSSLAIHWGTFELADDSLDEPLIALRSALQQDGFDPQDFWVIKQGESRPLSR
ncbi:MAG TPA: MBL fold metallo-hydrolase [Gammaproteobacteria bacterium]